MGGGGKLGGSQHKLALKSWWYCVAETHNLCASSMGSLRDGVSLGA